MPLDFGAGAKVLEQRSYGGIERARHLGGRAPKSGGPCRARRHTAPCAVRRVALAHGVIEGAVVLHATPVSRISEWHTPSHTLVGEGVCPQTGTRTSRHHSEGSHRIAPPLKHDSARRGLFPPPCSPVTGEMPCLLLARLLSTTPSGHPLTLHRGTHGTTRLHETPRVSSPPPAKPTSRPQALRRPPHAAPRAWPSFPPLHCSEHKPSAPRCPCRSTPGLASPRL